MSNIIETWHREMYIVLLICREAKFAVVSENHLFQDVLFRQSHYWHKVGLVRLRSNDGCIKGTLPYIEPLHFRVCSKTAATSIYEDRCREKMRVT